MDSLRKLGVLITYVSCGTYHCAAITSEVRRPPTRRAPFGTRGVCVCVLCAALTPRYGPGRSGNVGLQRGRLPRPPGVRGQRGGWVQQRGPPLQGSLRRVAAAP